MSIKLQHNFYRIIDGGTTNTDNNPQMPQLALDGQFGTATARRLQKYFDSAGKDGVISPVSNAVEELQRRLNANKL